ncbi:PepSY-associated TM helix domain-containing protein [Acinetobacter vivianii]|uniref:PepSY-associated TM helix domain-containing protein n=1 Tax=Acinetobacter vivianii TaxID=1776742 RepID=UPI002DB763FF|nr:PepSY-associated TM helix domain-containing protein [Acinetobacter vivianii]MEB6479392.1 PepSY domain-containing protein [Acinetobacter vivianii]MEB6656777.1 PepSY domain-containing protein [Acinetobacter vivianii]
MPQQPSYWRNLFRLVHIYAGIFVAPFIFIAAFTGFLYVSSPQLEQYIYKEQLYVHSENRPQQQLSLQVLAAQSVMAESARITELRPAPTSDQTTRVIYADPENKLNNQAVFVNPYTLEVMGQLPVYGTSGVLPLRTLIDQFHSNLLLGDVGRLYSELAASWLAILSLSGLYHWYIRRKHFNQSKTVRNKVLKWHSSIGIVLLPLLLIVAITGLTWSKWTGENIRILRQALNWQTPALVSSITGTHSVDSHAHHHSDMSQMSHQPLIKAEDFDQVLQLARQNGIRSAELQIKPPTTINTAWTVSEIRRRWPTEADSIAIDLRNNKVIDHLHFKDFPIAAKLTRWGVDAHIGILFGWINQLILMIYSLALCSMILLAFWLWSRTFNLKQTTSNFVKQSLQLWATGNIKQRFFLLLSLVILLICLPTLAISIAVAIAFIMLKQYQSRLL